MKNRLRVWILSKEISVRIYIQTVILVLLLIGLSSLPKLCFMDQDFIIPPPHEQYSFSILSANLGNLNLGCRNVLNKLCYIDVEERIKNNIRLLRPDIVILQEVLAPWQCAQINETNTNKVCSQAQLIPQARRLMGDEYTIACNNRNEFECIGIHKELGEILGCAVGSYCTNARTVAEIPDCDNGFTISSVTVKLRNGFIFDLLNAHPPSTKVDCRTKMLSMALSDSQSSGILTQDFVLLAGDFNLDPWRDNDESSTFWNDFVAKGWAHKQFNYHSGIAEQDPPLKTSHLFSDRTVDFLLSNFAKGICYTLGESQNTTRLDGGKGMDHRALFGYLTIIP